MTGAELSRSYLKKAQLRREILTLLANREGWSDLVREAQELVELTTKAILREAGIDPPRLHDMGPILVAEIDRFPGELVDKFRQLAAGSQWLRAQRELSFYGDVDWIPTERYTVIDGNKALAIADLSLSLAEKIITTKS